MRRFSILGLLALTGCANFCDTFFRARNVCRDQTAVQPVTVAAPMITCAGYSCACSAPMMTQVMSSPQEMAGVVDLGETAVSEPIVSQPMVQETVPLQPVSQKQGHPLLRPLQRLNPSNR